mgnify:CR=1 FL=1
MNVLVVEDDPRTASLLDDGLRLFGFDAQVARTGIDALGRVIRGDVDVLLLDLGLPDIDGWEVLRETRRVEPGLPVIVLTARDGIDDRVAGLDLGADDYVTKPFVFEELVARIRARLRARMDAGSVVRAGRINVDPVRRTVRVDDERVHLPDREFLLLMALLRRSNQIVSRRQLLAEVWGVTEDGRSNVVDVYIGYLRRKLGVAAIETVRGEGYRVPRL